MTKADLVNASLGATFGSLFGLILNKIIKGLEFVYHCPDQCKALREQLERLQPMEVKLSTQCQTVPRMEKWMAAFKECIEEAEKVMETCASDDPSASARIKDRYNEVAYGRQILKIRDRMGELISEGTFLLQANQCKPRFGTGWTKQTVPQKILGMEEHLGKVKSSIIEGRNSVSSSSVGIRGMGGSGKTILAQMVNNDKNIQELFGKENMFWLTVGRDASISAIYAQMRNYLHVDAGVAEDKNLNDQRTDLVDAFSRRKNILVILDDVWDMVHEHETVGEWLNIARGPGSVTLMTTRQEAVTVQACGKVEVTLLLSENDSWELFCLHAFGIYPPPSSIEHLELARDVCKECQHLPLALKVIGTAMKGKVDVAEWRRTLCRLGECTSVNKSVEEQLSDRLKISYDDLADEALKICFLYFAAFPEDCAIPEEYLCEIWVAEGFFGEERSKQDTLDEGYCALKELSRRSLIDDCSPVRWENVKCVKMHDCLRDLAVRMSSHAGERASESLFKLEKKDLETFPTSWVDTLLSVKRMSVWGQKLKKFPDNFTAPCLKVCKLYPTPWEHVYEPWSQSHEVIIEDKFFEGISAMRWIEICHNRCLTKLPNSIGGLGFLQHLNLSGCRRLKRLPERIGELESLQHLNLLCCSKLQKLPESIERLGSLQHLSLEGCTMLEKLPESIERLGSLQHLNLEGCTKLEKLPESIERLGSLQHLNLFNCTKLKELPGKIGRLGSLQHRDLSYCRKLETLPGSVGGLGSLQHLNLHGCTKLKSLPESIGGLGSLQHLDLTNCTKLERLPESISGLGSLQHLNLDRCRKLEELPERIGEVGSLQSLNLDSCTKLERLPKSICGLGSLQNLCLGNCSNLKELPQEIGRLGSLRLLSLDWCLALTELPVSIGKLEALEMLKLRECPAWNQLPTFTQSRLKILNT